VAQRRHIPDTVVQRAKELKEERDFRSVGEAIRYMCREGEYDV